jgi:hypothetical protein
LNNLSFTVNYNPSLENNTVTYFSTSKSSCLVYILAKRDHKNRPLFSKLHMLPFIPWGEAAFSSNFLAIVTSSLICFLKFRRQLMIRKHMATRGQCNKLIIVKWKCHPIRSAYLRVNHYLTTK